MIGFMVILLLVVSGIALAAAVCLVVDAIMQFINIILK